VDLAGSTGVPGDTARRYRHPVLTADGRRRRRVGRAGNGLWVIDLP
jgi:hypothetical protein